MKNLENIKLNEKYTIVMDDSSILGNVMCKAIKCTIKEIQIGEYAQFKTTLKLKIRRFKCRRDEIITVIFESVAIIKGWINFDTMIRSNIKTDGAITTSNLSAASPKALKDNKNLIFWKDKGELKGYNDVNALIEITGEYIGNRRLQGLKERNQGYFNVLKEILIKYGYSIGGNLYNAIREEMGEIELIQDLKSLETEFYNY